jgi:hypothetical protein
MRRLAFVPNPHVRLDRSWAAPYVPLELLSGMAVVERAGAEACLFDVNRLVEAGMIEVRKDLWRDASSLLAELRPDLVVFETWTGTLHNTLLFVEAARKKLAGVPLVLVGAGVSACAAEILRSFPSVDAVVRGEVEPALEAMARHDPTRLRKIPGLVRRFRDGIEDAPLAFVEDLARLPRPAYHLAPIDAGDTIPVEPGRGCEQNCSFCALAGHWPRRYRPKSPARLAEEMIHLGRRYPGSALDLTQDPTYFADSARIEALTSELRGQSLAWSCHARVDRLEERDLVRLKEAGCRGILLGIESGCPATQRAIGKHICLDCLEPTIASATALGIEVQTTFILGFPDEDETASSSTVHAMLRARRAGAADPVAQPLRAYPGSGVHDRHAAELVFEPILSTAAPGDRASLELILNHPELFPASYRVPGRLGWPALSSIWIAASAYLDVLESLDRHGVDLEMILGSLSGAAEAKTLGEAVRAVGRDLIRATAGTSSVDPRLFADLVSYHRAIHELCQETAPRGSLIRSVDAVQAVTDSWVPRLLTPWRLLRLTTPVEAILSGELRIASRTFEQWLLLAKVPNTGRVSYYTSRSSSVETFVLDRLAATALPLCSGAWDLGTIGHRVAACLGERTEPTVAACRLMLDELGSARVAALEPPTG